MSSLRNDKLDLYVYMSILATEKNHWGHVCICRSLHTMPEEFFCSLTQTSDSNFKCIWDQEQDPVCENCVFHAGCLFGLRHHSRPCLQVARLFFGTFLGSFTFSLTGHAFLVSRSTYISHQALCRRLQNPGLCFTGASSPPLLFRFPEHKQAGLCCSVIF